jgi:hypothetical protein
METLLDKYREQKIQEFESLTKQDLELEKCLELLENIIEIDADPDDYANLHYLNYNLSRKKFDQEDIKVFNKLKAKYLWI